MVLMPRSSYEKSEETRARIIETAHRLFVDHGYSATSMRDISQGAGVTVGAIYNHFATKEAIWLEVLMTHHPYRAIFAEILAAQGETVADVVRSAANGLVRALSGRPDLLNLMFIEIVEFKASHIPVLFQAILPELMRISSIFDGKRGKVRDLPLPILIRSFAGLIFSYNITGMLGSGLAEISNDEESLRQVVDLFLYGLLADDDAARDNAARKEGA